VDRPYILLSCAMSLDGYIDDRTDQPLRLSSAPDADRVDELRASCDAILVGAATIRADDPVLMLRSQGRRDLRAAAGFGPDPVRVVISGSGDLEPAARLFTTGGDRIVYVASHALARAKERLAGSSEVVAAGDPLELGRVVADLAARGVSRLLVEGGGRTHTQFLVAGLADELRLSVAPFFVGDSAAPRFVADGRFPWDQAHRARLAEVTRAGDMAVLRYALSGRYDARSRDNQERSEPEAGG
jgi:riboflavin-specific deaminase-like protein